MDREEDKEKDNICAHGCEACGGCSHDDGEIPDDMDPIITLTDEDGKDVKFEIIDVVTLEDDKEFLIVTEADSDDKEKVEVVILEIKEVDGEEVYDTVTDDKLAEKVFNQFTKQQEEEDKE